VEEAGTRIKVLVYLICFFHHRCRSDATMKFGLKGLVLASTVGLGAALISGCNSEEAPPASPAPSAPSSVAPAPSAPKETTEAAPAPTDAPKAGEPEKKD
jgi:hypothetical protein